MEDRDYRSEVGKKIEEALAMGDFDLVEDLIEVPPMETFMQWAEKGEEKRKKRVCRKRILVSCLAIVVVSASVLIGLKCFALPEVTADPEDDVTIDMSDMESIETYSSWDALPDEIKEQFIEVKDLPEGYVVEKVEVVECNLATKVILIANYKGDKIEIRQNMNKEGSLFTNAVPEENASITVEGTNIHVETDTQLKINTYKFVCGKAMVDVVVPIAFAKGEVENVIRTVL